MCTRNWQKRIRTRTPLIVQLVNYIAKDGRQNHQFECFVSQNNIFWMLYSIYIPTINAVETRLNMLIASMDGLLSESETSFNPE